jgi:superfamily II DNA or RNA helicase
MVVASIDTLRLDYHGRQERLLASDPWDLVIVDEAHHLNCDPKQGPTLGYNFIQTLLKNDKIGSMIFFTGTPHKGKNFSFLSLMKLLDNEAFDQKGTLAEHLNILKNYMIRNNKYNVTDLLGNRFFTEPEVCSTTYSYSCDEQIFYETLPEFISNGMAYASRLNHETGRIVMFVLISMQKLASSSVAAIKHALRKRVNRYKEAEIRTLQQFKHKILKESKIASPMSEIVVQSLSELGDSHISEETIKIIRAKITAVERKKLWDETQYVRSWIRSAIELICQEGDEVNG